MQQLALEFKGLKTNPSPLDLKPGSMSQAQNVNIDSPNTITCRRGFNQFGDAIGDVDVCTRMFEYKDRIIQYRGNFVSCSVINHKSYHN